jgi:hypothetical protein
LTLKNLRKHFVKICNLTVIPNQCVKSWVIIKRGQNSYETVFNSESLKYHTERAVTPQGFSIPKTVFKWELATHLRIARQCPLDNNTNNAIVQKKTKIKNVAISS